VLVPTSPLSAALPHLFDDASLFPPASLTMAPALAGHAEALAGAHGEVVGPFLCPASRLAELDACVAGGAARPPALGVIGYPGQLGWRRALATRGVVQAEAPLAADMPMPPVRVVRYLELAHHGPVDHQLDTVMVAGARAKVRCGGLTRDAVPSSAWLAAVLVGCVARGLTLKATAGLHEPFHTNGEDGPRHGFVNLLAAAARARKRGRVAEVAAVLDADESAADELVQQVGGSRALVASIGTCSISEPLDALAARGLL
jgi:hypothetical protein